MPAVQCSIIINAPTERVWEAFMELESWPAWNPHMREVRRLAEGPLAMGSRAHIILKSRMASTWEVTETISGGRCFIVGSWGMAGQLNIYINGLPAQIGPTNYWGSLFDLNKPFTLGRFQDAAGSFKGSMAQPFVILARLSDDEVLALHDRTLLR